MIHSKWIKNNRTIPALSISINYFLLLIITKQYQKIYYQNPGVSDSTMKPSLPPARGYPEAKDAFAPYGSDVGPRRAEHLIETVDLDPHINCRQLTKSDFIKDPGADSIRI